MMLAITAAAITMATKTVTAMATIQSNLDSDIGDLARTNKYVFIAYIGVLAATVILSVLLWVSGNKLQDAIKRTGEARTEEAKRGAADALKDAGTANQRAEELEKANLTLRGQVATLETAATDAKKDVAGLQTAAADAKAEQQRVQIELARQQQLTANAITGQEELRRQNIELGFTLEGEKRTRLQLEEAIAPRSVRPTAYEDKETREFLERFAGSEVEIFAVDDFECRRLARQIADLVSIGGWKVLSLEVLSDVDELRVPVGLDIGLNIPTDQSPMRPAAEALSRVLSMSRVPARVTFTGWSVKKVAIGQNPSVGETPMPPNRVRIMVGLRPDWYFDAKRFREENEERRRREMYEQPVREKPKAE